MKKKILLVFGSKGFVASSLKKKFKHNKITNVKFLDKKKFNLLNEKNLEKISLLISKNTVIIFISAIAPSKTNNDFIENIQMILNLNKILKKKNFSKLIYISSDAVYSDTRKLITEDSDTNPTSSHGLMHKIRENIIKNSFMKKLLILRPTLIYGENDTHNGYGPNQFIRLAKLNKDIKLFGKGEEKRDHVYIGDLIDVIIKSTNNNLIGTYNVCTGKIFSFYEIAKKIILISKSRSKIVFIKRNGPPHHLGIRQFNIKKIKKVFPKTKLKCLDEMLTMKFINKY